MRARSRACSARDVGALPPSAGLRLAAPSGLPAAFLGSADFFGSGFFGSAAFFGSSFGVPWATLGCGSAFCASRALAASFSARRRSSASLAFSSACCLRLGRSLGLLRRRFCWRCSSTAGALPSSAASLAFGFALGSARPSCRASASSRLLGLLGLGRFFGFLPRRPCELPPPSSLRRPSWLRRRAWPPRPSWHPPQPWLRQLLRLVGPLGVSVFFASATLRASSAFVASSAFLASATRWPPRPSWRPPPPWLRRPSSPRPPSWRPRPSWPRRLARFFGLRSSAFASATRPPLGLLRSLGLGDLLRLVRPLDLVGLLRLGGLPRVLGALGLLGRLGVRRLLRLFRLQRVLGLLDLGLALGRLRPARLRQSALLLRLDGLRRLGRLRAGWRGRRDHRCGLCHLGRLLGLRLGLRLGGGLLSAAGFLACGSGSLGGAAPSASLRMISWKRSLDRVSQSEAPASSFGSDVPAPGRLRLGLCCRRARRRRRLRRGRTARLAEAPHDRLVLVVGALEPLERRRPGIVPRRCPPGRRGCLPCGSGPRARPS